MEQTWSLLQFTQELVMAERYLVKLSQEDNFSTKIALLKAKHSLPNNSCLLSLHPFLLDSDGVLRIGGQQSNSKLSYLRMHPIILHEKH